VFSNWYNRSMPIRKRLYRGWRTYRRLLIALFVANLVALFLFATRSVSVQSNRYWFIVWNLLLAWLPLLLMVWLRYRLQTTKTLGWQNFVLFLLWLGFLPNSFYMATDLIHLHATGEVSLLYDVVMFCSFIFCAFTVGFMSVYIMHKELIRQISSRAASLVIGLIFLACSYAIYLGRSLRWNSWDILINPAGLLFDLSDQIINPAARSHLFVTTATFFLLLTSMYVVIWELAHIVEDNH